MPDRLHVEEFLPYMPSVSKCERALMDLNFAWRLIESTAKMVCPLEAKAILPTMKSTREGFNKLEEQLIFNLVQENITKSVQEIRFKAQVIIDIVVRNLFERTADVGFLAMDDAIRDFILDEERDAERLVPRLKQYRDKYTVYDEILILDLKGNVLAQLDKAHKLTHSTDPLIAETLACDVYVETFRKSDLRPMLDRSLIYSRKITHPSSGQPIGVLCLCFPLAVEMVGVFAGLRKEVERSVMLMLDGDGYVIASSDEDHIAPGKRVPFAFKDDYEIVMYAGREYFAKTCAAQNYQGYGGPGWLGHVMIPCETAFRHQYSDALSSYDATMLAGIMSHAKSFCPPLHDIALKADEINVALRRVVWNGQIMSNGQNGDLLKLKAILQEISQTGEETSRIFGDSIHDLYSTVISSSLQDTQFISRLIIDIMDRNLYERANDCRWWALTPDIRRLMANKTRTADDQKHITQILEAINALYTAYSRLVVFDTSGVIVAASDLHQDGMETVGRTMEESLVRQTLGLRGSQAYCVSPFESTWLYGDRPTYIYCAAIPHPDEPSRSVGGIGIVFDSEPEFRNMLLSSLPKREGTFAAFTDRAGKVISSTHPDYPAGTTLCPEGSLLNQKNGVSGAGIIVHEGHYVMAGHTTSFGYREYKNSGDYQNDIVAMVFVPIGAQKKMRADNQDYSKLSSQSMRATGTDLQEFATFMMEGNIYALPVSSVVEAVEARRVNPASTLKPLIAGVLDFHHNNGEKSSFVPVVDMNYLMNSGMEQSDKASQVIVVKRGLHTVGLLVGDLHDVAEFSAQQIEPVPQLHHNRTNYVCNLIKTGSHNHMIQVVDPDRIFEKVFPGT